VCAISIVIYFSRTHTTLIHNIIIYIMEHDNELCADAYSLFVPVRSTIRINVHPAIFYYNIYTLYICMFIEHTYNRTKIVI